MNSPPDNDEETLFLQATPGLEDVLRKEALALGFTGVGVEGGVEVTGAPGLYRRANLHLRTASRVLLRLATFEVRHLRDLENGLLKLPWSKFGPQFHVRVVTHETALGRAGELKKRVEARLKIRPSFKGTEILVRIVGTTCTVSLDSSGPLLHLRGYRQEVGTAPLRETLAAGMLLSAGYTGQAPLWDFMCGSGTLLIEGAWMAARRAPGLDRRFAFESWPCHLSKEFEREKKEAIEQTQKPLFSLRGTDLHAGQLGVTRRNSKRAGVWDWLSVERQDATKVKCPSDGPPGLLVANLPYGKRAGEANTLSSLYSNLGKHLKKEFPGWRFAFLVHDTQSEKWLGLTLGAVCPVDNGGMACRLLTGSL